MDATFLRCLRLREKELAGRVKESGAAGRGGSDCDEVLMGGSGCLTDVAVRLSPCSCEVVELGQAATRRLGVAGSKWTEVAW